MARLSKKARAKMPSKEFAGPHRSFPTNDRAHDMAAIMDVGSAVRAGHISAAEGAEIKATARHKLEKIKGHVKGDHYEIKGNK